MAPVFLVFLPHLFGSDLNSAAMSVVNRKNSKRRILDIGGATFRIHGRRASFRYCSGRVKRRDSKRHSRLWGRFLSAYD